MNDGSSPATDETSNGYDMTDEGGGCTFGFTGQFGDAVDCDGTTDANLQSNANVAAARSLSTGSVVLWWNGDTTGFSPLFNVSTDGSNNNFMAISLDSGGSLPFHVQCKTTSDQLKYTSTESVSVNTWTHIAFTTGSGANNAYIDGTEITYSCSTPSTNCDATQKFFSNCNGSQNSWTLMRREIGGDSFADGTMDEAALMDDVLTSTEINDIKDNGIKVAGGGAERRVFLVERDREKYLDLVWLRKQIRDSIIETANKYDRGLK